MLSMACCLIAFAVSSQRNKSAHLTWKEVKKVKQGLIEVYWYESRPFVYKNEMGRMEGIEVELIEEFKRYVKEKYRVNITVKWTEATDFGNTYATIRNSRQEGVFGVSAFSITPERQQEVGFTPPYMKDICVLISSQNIPIVKSAEEFDALFSKLTAIAIKETTYEQDLQKLREEKNLSFPIHYIPSSENIVTSISDRNDSFAFIDLPIYLMMFSENPSIKVRRQNIFPIIRTGYGIIYPKTSDWAEPWNDYFADTKSKAKTEQIIGHYIDRDLYLFVENFARQSNAPVALLTKEKEIQSKDLVSKSVKIEKEEQARNVLIGLSGTTLFSLGVIIILYRKRNQQKKKIEAQQQNIELKSEQLEKRNRHLMTIDEEKNNLIKILAHDLRTPINHVQGLAQVFLLTYPSLNEDQKMIIRQINDSSVRLNKMITNLLDIDAVESNRVNLLIEEITITKLVRQVVSTFEKSAEKKQITLVFSSASETEVIKGDSLFLIQIMENLISNAIKFSEKGKKIEVSIKTANNKIQISVRDQGQGLTPEDLQNLFKKFQRLSARPTDGENSLGLGLSIVKKYVDLMDGKIWCESQPNKGAEFIIEFDKG